MHVRRVVRIASVRDDAAAEADALRRGSGKSRSQKPTPTCDHHRAGCPGITAIH